MASNDDKVKVRVFVELRGTAARTVEMSRDDYKRLDKEIDASDRVVRWHAESEIHELLPTDIYDDVEIESIEEFEEVRS